MDSAITYQEDSVATNSQLNTQAETQQINNLRVQQENLQLTDSSKFIDSKADLGLNYTESPAPEIILPVREKSSTGTDWLTVILFAAILLFASIRYSYIKYIKHLFTSLVNYPTSVRLLQESTYPASHAAYRLDVVFYLTSSIFVYQALNVFELAEASNKFFYFALVIAAVFLYFTGKKFLYKVTGLMFETRSETDEYLFNINNTNRSLGLVLLPLVALVSFSPLHSPVPLIVTGIGIITVFQLFLLQRGILILLRKQFSILYLFLYLCTLEFLPLLLIYKIVVVE